MWCDMLGDLCRCPICPMGLLACSTMVGSRNRPTAIVGAGMRFSDLFRVATVLGRCYDGVEDLRLGSYQFVIR